MKFLFDLLPVLVFFIVYRCFNLYAATAATIGVSVLQTAYYWMKHRHVDYLLLATTLLIVIFGSMTLVFHNEMFIKWKPTAISWLFALAFLLSPWFGSKKPLIQLMLASTLKRMSQEEYELPVFLWQRLNAWWISFYTALGAVNIYVAYHYDTSTWVNFKAFGLLGLTFVFVFAQLTYLSRYLAHVKS